MKVKDNRRLQKLRSEFLPEAMEIVETPTSPVGRGIIWAVFLLLIITVVWACMGKVDEVSVARGQVQGENEVQKIQSAGTGIIRTVNVKEGDRVRKGDVLYVLDKEVEKSSITYSEGETGLNELRVELLTRMLDSADISGYRKMELTEEQKQVLDYMLSLQEADYLAVNAYEAAIANARNQFELAKKGYINQKEQGDYLESQEEIAGEKRDTDSSLAEQELKLLEQDYEYAKDEAERYRKLYQAGAKSKAQWEEKMQNVRTAAARVSIKQSEMEQAEVSAAADENSADYRMSENSQQVITKAGSVEQYKGSYESAVDDLEKYRKQRTTELYEMRQGYLDELKKQGLSVEQEYYEYENRDIRAPFDGVVKTLVTEHAGTVVSAAQDVAELVPDAKYMIVSAEVENADIGHIKEGQEVSIKIDTYDYQKYGMLSGTVSYISPDATENEKMQKVYQVDIRLEKSKLAGKKLAQGMECSVEIKTGKRRIIEFFLEPLTDALKQSIRER